MATTILGDGRSGARPEDFSVILANKTDNSHADPATNRDMNSEEVRLLHQMWDEGCVEQWEINPHPTLRRIFIGSRAKEDMAFVEGATGAGTYLVRKDFQRAEFEMPLAHPTENRLHHIYLVVFDRLYRSNSQSRTSATFAVVSQQTAGETLTPDSTWSGSLLLGTVLQRAGSTTFTQNDITVYPRIGQTVSGVDGEVNAFNDPVQTLATPRFQVPYASIPDRAHTHSLEDIPATSAKGVLFAWTTGWGGAYDNTAILPISGRAQVFSQTVGSRTLRAADSLPNGNSGFATVDAFFSAWERIISLETVIFQGGANEPLRFSRQSGTTQFATVTRLPRTVFSPADQVGAVNQPTTLRMDFDMVRFSGQNPGVLPVVFNFDPTNRTIGAWVNSNTQRTEDRDVFVSTSSQATRMTRFQVNVHYEAARTP